MHGMLSAAVMLAAFAVIALAAAASVVWLYRATGAYAQRSRPALAGQPGDAAGPDTPAAALDVAVPAPDDGIAGPDEGAGPRDAVDVYDVEDWADPDGSRDLDGLASRGPGAWPNPSSSLYSRGWPAMDSPRTPRGQAYGAEPREPDQQAPGGYDGLGVENPADGPYAQVPADLGDGHYGPADWASQGRADWASQGRADWASQGRADWASRGRGDQAGQDQDPRELGNREPDSQKLNGQEPGSEGPGSEGPGSEGPGSEEPGGPHAAATGRTEGARVYVLGESRRRGR